MSTRAAWCCAAPGRSTGSRTRCPACATACSYKGLCDPDVVTHGPYVSQKGILLLVHSTSPMPTAYTDFPAGPEICRHYLETTPLIEHACTDPWHIRPEQAVWEEMTTR